MGTRNGADFLAAQLDSFLEQDHGDWSLWVSDDGSDDDTCNILERFAADHPDREVRILRGPGQGPAQNYLSLLCHPDLPDDHVALADQDDIWLPGKLSRALVVMAGVRPDAPALYAAQSVIADMQLRPRRITSDPPRPPELRNALVQNLFAGHSTVLNPAALRLVRQAGQASGIPYHDWWLYLLLSASGAHCLLDQEPVVIWRQHAANTIGAAGRLGGLRRRVHVMWSGQYRDWIDRQLAHLGAQETLLTGEARQILDGYARASRRAGPLRALGYARLGLRRQTLAGTALFYALAIMGRA